MRPLEEMSMHLRTRGKGKGHTYEVKMGGGYYTNERFALVVPGVNSISVTIKTRKKGLWKQTFRKPTIEELEFVRALFFYPQDYVTIQIYEPHRGFTVVLKESIRNRK